MTEVEFIHKNGEKLRFALVFAMTMAKFVGNDGDAENFRDIHNDLIDILKPEKVDTT